MTEDEIEDELRKLKALPREELRARFFPVERMVSILIPLIFLGFTLVLIWDFGEFRWFIIIPAMLITLKGIKASWNAVSPATVGGIERRSGIPGYAGSGNLTEARQELDPLRLKDGTWGVALKSRPRVGGFLIFGTLFSAMWIFGTAHALSVDLSLGMILAFVGLLPVVPTLYYWLKAIGPRVRITVPSNVIPLGSALQVRWTTSGIGQMSNMQITLVGKERTRYTRGTTTYTDDSVLGEFSLMYTEEQKKIREGKTSIDIPTLAMHTFEAGSNSIFWEMKVEGVVPFWPDTNDSYPIILVPPEVPND